MLKSATVLQLTIMTHTHVHKYRQSRLTFQPMHNTVTRLAQAPSRFQFFTQFFIHFLSNASHTHYDGAYNYT